LRKGKNSSEEKQNRGKRFFWHTKEEKRGGGHLKAGDNLNRKHCATKDLGDLEKTKKKRDCGGREGGQRTNQNGHVNSRAKGYPRGGGLLGANLRERGGGKWWVMRDSNFKKWERRKKAEMEKA